MSLHNRKSLAPWIRDDIEFYQHQVDGVRQMMRMQSGILGDAMGLGKTLQILTVFAADVKQGHASKAIVVCPASLKFNWAAEVEKFTSFGCVVLNGSAPKRLEQLREFKDIQGPKILIVNYEQVSSHLGALNDQFFDVGIFDEAHMLKNPRAERTKACRKLATKRSWMLTGSPIMHNVSDLWVLLDRVSPGAFKSYYAFRNRFCAFGGYQDKQIVGVKNERELSEALSQLMLRRMKEDVLDLPDVQYITRQVALDSMQKKLYDAAYNEMRIEFGTGDIATEIANAAVRFLRCRQICGTTFTVTDFDKSEKLNVAVNDLLEITDNGHHVVVFSQFRKVQEAFVARIKKQRPDLPVYEMNGSVAAQDRVPMVEKWSAENCAVMVASYQVAGVGLNMTRARFAMLLDKFPSPALVQQAVDRLHRIGASSEHSVQVLQYIAANTVEHRIEQILATKKKLSASVVDAAQDTNTAAIMRAVIEADRKQEEYINV